jgi:hypothetical protein
LDREVLEAANERETLEPIFPQQVRWQYHSKRSPLRSNPFSLWSLLTVQRHDDGLVVVWDFVLGR